MCGIAGFVGFDDDPLLRAMCASLSHRGPDDSGLFTAPGVGLVHRRLSVIDLTTGRQPMSNEDGTVWVVFNGEIYNYQDLARDLKQRGHRFSSTSDTETIVHLYEEYGLGLVDHMRGMFAFGLWDARRKRLVLVRDRIGEKPLYYMEDGAAILFGSEPKAILQKKFTRQVDAQAVCEFLVANYVPPPRSFYQGVCKLPAGHMLVHENGRARLTAYWQRGSRGASSLSFNEAAERLASLLSDTVKLCLKSDVEVGAFLSGGIDSSVIVALMCSHAAHVQTFTVGFAGAATGFNELRQSRFVADQLGTKHQELILSPQSSIELLPRIVGHFDEPSGNPTSVLVYLLSRFTKQRVKVVLGGTGGDEIFFGYPRHRAVNLLAYYRICPRFIREQLVERIIRKWPESTRGRAFARQAKRFITGSGLPPAEAYLTWISLLHRDVRERMLSERTRAEADDPMGEAFLRHYLLAGDQREILDRVADLDLAGYLPEFQLRYMDRMSMAHGLEVRSPLCDYELVDFVTSLPASYRLKRTHSKHILKTIASRWIPPHIAERTKRGFDSPIGQWVKEDLREFVLNFLSREHVGRSGLLDPEVVQQLLGEHLSGRRDYYIQLWSLLTLECWYRMYIEGGATGPQNVLLDDIRGAACRGKTVGLGGAKATDSCASSVAPPRMEKHGRGGWTRRHLWQATPRSLRRSLAPLLGRIPVEKLLGKQFRNWVAFLEKSQFWPAEVSTQYRALMLRAVCGLAYVKSPFYRRVFDEAGFDPQDLNRPEDLVRIPTIDKQTVREHLEEIRTIPAGHPAVEAVSTGGSGGEPLMFCINANRSPVEYAHLTTSWRRAGCAVGTTMAVLRGQVVEPDQNGFRHEYDPILRAHYYSAFHMNDESLRGYVRHIAGIGRCFLHVYPSSVATLARFIERSGTPVPRNIVGILAGSENVYPEQRAYVEKVLGVRYFAWYGHSEKLVLAAECEYTTDYHVWPTYGHFELLDEQGNPVNVPGQRGEIVGTGFINTVLPFIRYRTGDWATFVANCCEACGRRHTIIRDIRGHRTQETLVADDGSEIPWTAMNMHDDTFAAVRQFQFYQDTPGRAVLRIVPAVGFGEEHRQRIMRNLGRKLDGRVAFTVECVESILLSPRGKAIYVDQRIPALSETRLGR